MGEEFFDCGFRQIIYRHMKRNIVMNSNARSPGSQSVCHECVNCSKWIVNKGTQPRAVSCKCITSAFSLPFSPAGDQSDVAAQQRFHVFDQSGGKINLIISPIRPPVSNLNQKPLASSGHHVNFLVNRSTNDDQIESNKAKTSNSNEGDEMHEDTEEIDALLYSGSEDEEETSTGHSPDKTSASNEEVASSSVPTKRKRIVEDIDTSLADTASSEAGFHHCQNSCNSGKCCAVKHSCVRSLGKERDTSLAGGPNRRSKRERIHETMVLLRRIIPGAKGKDKIALLDKAIRYLRSLKAQAKN